MGTFKIFDMMVTLAHEDAACAKGEPTVAQPLCANSPPHHMYKVIEAIAELGTAELTELKGQLQTAIDKATAREEELKANADGAGKSLPLYELEELHKRLTAAAESVLARIKSTD